MDIPAQKLTFDVFRRKIFGKENIKISSRRFLPFFENAHAVQTFLQSR